MNYDPARDCEETPKGDCIINAIERNKKTLENSNAPAVLRREALMFIVHFIGDLHQPLHTVKDDVGGNTFPVNSFVDPAKKKVETTNLHSAWDSNLIRVTTWAWGSYVTLVENWLNGKDSAALSTGTPVEWALDAHKAAVNVGFTVKRGAMLDEDYLKLAQPVVNQQLALAGVRLAHILNGALK